MNSSDSEEYIDQKYIEGFPLQTMQYLRHPFKLIVLIVVELKNGVKWHGTGCIVEQSIVLTCLHNLVNKNGKLTQPEDIKVYAGQNGPIKKEDAYEVLDFKYNKDYFSKPKHNKITRRQKAYDYAMLFLKPKQQQLIDQMNKLTISIPQFQDQKKNKKSHAFQLYGYDQRGNVNNHQNNQYKLLGCKTDMLEMDENFIDYQVSTDCGKSGAPLISYSKHGLFKIIGIHLASIAKKDTNFALRINQQVIRKIRQWMEQWQKADQILNPLISKLHIHQQKESNKSNKIYASENQSIKDMQNEKIPSFFSFNTIKEYFITLSQSLYFIETQAKKVASSKSNPSQKEVTLPVKQVKYSNHCYQSPKLFKTHSYQISVQHQNQASHLPNKSQVIQGQKSSAPQFLNKKEDIQQFTGFQANLLQYLEYLNGTIKIQLIPEFFHNLKSLKLNYCKIKSVPSLSKLKKLEYIDCSQNFIIQISNFLTKYVNYLFLNKNLIKEVPAQIVDAKSLIQLSLSHNYELQKIHPNILEINLKKLLLNGKIRFCQDIQNVNKLADSIQQVLTDISY